MARSVFPVHRLAHTSGAKGIATSIKCNCGIHTHIQMKMRENINKIDKNQSRNNKHKKNYFFAHLSPKAICTHFSRYTYEKRR